MKATANYKNGCYVQHGHDIAFLEDTDADGRADKRTVILTGFGVQDSHLFPHQFLRAPGGWIWMAQGAFNSSKVRQPNEPAGRVLLQFFSLFVLLLLLLNPASERA